MSNKIKFLYTSEYAWDAVMRPAPASEYIPKWHRDMEPYHGGKLMINNRDSSATPKKCVPMLDAITSGYIIPLWADIMVNQNETDVMMDWKVSHDVFQTHGDSSGMVPAPDGYHKNAFKYISNLAIETPKGYSILVKQPSGHYDLPFLAISAVIDSDKPTVDLAFPVWIKQNVSGIVQKGTPMIQVIPFKRDNWKSEFDFVTQEKFSSRMDKYFHSTIKNNYFKNTWSRKEYK